MAKNNKNFKSKFVDGDSLYYNVLYPNGNQAVAVRKTTKSALKPYHDFLSKAIEAEETKGSYEIKCRLIESKKAIKIAPHYSQFKIEKPKTTFRIRLNDGQDLQEERNKIFFDAQDETRRFNKNEIKRNDDWLELDLDILPQENEMVELDNQSVKYELVSLVVKNGDEIECKGEAFKITKLEEVDGGWNCWLETNREIKEARYNSQTIVIKKYKDTLPEKLFDNGGEYACELFGSEYKSETLPTNKILKDDNERQYSWSEVETNNARNDITIQLIDDDSTDDKPISDYFFADDVKEIYQDNPKNGFAIQSRKTDDRILILKPDFKNPKKLIDNQPIKIKVDTGNLKKQRDSVKLLNASPAKEQKNLIKLFEKKRLRLWDDLKKESIEHWFILNDEKYDGTIDQRNFVQKAIATDDFAILEGPPGSGKTTTILELILQLAKQGKKILLSASTHVAIDNVLERIEKYDTEQLIEPLRIGRSGSVGEAVEHFQIDKKIEANINNGFSKELAEQIALDSANLVCGTTMGINQFPPIRDRVKYPNGKRTETPLPLDTMFDCMIIDESSKTTFQEFLVPAMAAKKWILVGDIKQLSPFIEQSHIVHNLDSLIPKPIQKAIRVVFETLKNNENPYIVEVSFDEEQEIRTYLDVWNNREDNPYANKTVSYSDEEDLFDLLSSDLILLQEGDFETRQDELPKTHILILKKEREENRFLLQQSYLHKQRKLPSYGKVHRKSSSINHPMEYEEFFKALLREKSWADEIAWRMIRVYERRMLKNPNSYYERTYELLKPVTKNENEVERIYNMTLPSILESIQVGNGEQHRNATTITEGFHPADLKRRHETLKTQHRMAPDISKFSRKHFYTTDGLEALKDAKTIDREWEYDRYNSGAVWIDIVKDRSDKNDRRNEKEAKQIIEEIKSFLDFTKLQPSNKEGKPWSIAVLSFYRPQEALIRKKLQDYCSQPNKMSRFAKDKIEILLYTVDKFQGMEADIVFLSMVRGNSIGFMDNINRLNVALTRAKYQRVIVGDKKFFANQKGSDELRELTKDGDQ